MKIHRPFRGIGDLGAEQGSAYIVALLLLLLLTVIGLSLSLVTQNELQIGANEKLINRVFYAADAAISESTSRALILGEFSAGSSFTPDSTPSAANLGIEVQRNSYTRLNSPYCALCEVNQQPGEEPYRDITYYVDVTARRTGTAGGSSVALAEKQLTAMLDIQPYKPQLPVLP